MSLQAFTPASAVPSSRPALIRPLSASRLSRGRGTIRCAAGSESPAEAASAAARSAKLIQLDEELRRLSNPSRATPPLPAPEPVAPAIVGTPRPFFAFGSRSACLPDLSPTATFSTELPPPESGPVSTSLQGPGAVPLGSLVGPAVFFLFVFTIAANALYAVFSPPPPL